MWFVSEYFFGNIFKWARPDLFIDSPLVLSYTIYCLHIVKGVQVLLYNVNSSICTVKWFQAFLFNSNTNNSIWSIDRILIDIITPGHSGPGSNDKEEVQYFL